MWNIAKQKNEPTPKKIAAFLEDYAVLCLEHAMCLGHEDTQGAFIIENFDTDTIAWVQAAHDNTTPGRINEMLNNPVPKSTMLSDAQCDAMQRRFTPAEISLINGGEMVAATKSVKEREQCSLGDALQATTYLRSLIKGKR